MAAEYAARNGLHLDTELTFQDLGISAFRGKNAEVGRLAEFSRAVASGLVPPGSFLLVESLDRISRQAARKALRVLEDIVESGVTVVTLNDGRAYSASGLDTDPIALMIALLTFIRANEESATKSRRLRAVWEQKRKKAAVAKTPATALMPAWLRLNRLSGRIEVIPDRAEVVQRIFDMAVSGVGLHGIASALNSEGVPPFGRGAAVKAKLWHRSYVAKIVDNPAVVGTFLPHVMEHDANGRSRKPVEPVHGYFPAIVREDLFHRVRTMRADGRAPATRTGKSETVSLLAGLACCPLCGNTMTRVNKGSAKKAGVPRLVCTMARAKRCGAASIRQDVAEAALLRHASEVFQEVPVPDLMDHWFSQHEVEGAESHLLALRGKIERVLDEIAAGTGPSEALRAHLDKLEAELEATKQRRDGIAARLATAQPALLNRALSDLRQTLGLAVLHRQSINGLLRQVLASVTLDAEAKQMTLTWKHGAETVIGLPSGRDNRAPIGSAVTNRAAMLYGP
jgi:DNA invertase Pin-like site-specific DNA recombinase